MVWLWSRAHILPTGCITTVLPRRRSTRPVLLTKLPCPTELSLNGRGSGTWTGWPISTFFLQKFLEEVQAVSGGEGVADKWTPTSESLGPFIDQSLALNLELQKFDHCTQLGTFNAHPGPTGTTIIIKWPDSSRQIAQSQ